MMWIPAVLGMVVGFCVGYLVMEKRWRMRRRGRLKKRMRLWREMRQRGF